MLCNKILLTENAVSNEAFSTSSPGVTASIASPPQAVNANKLAKNKNFAFRTLLKTGALDKARTIAGYTKNKKGKEIPTTSQIILIVDSFSAMTSYRPYRKPYSEDEAIEEIRADMGIKYSPELVEAFVYAVKETRNG